MATVIGQRQEELVTGSDFKGAKGPDRKEICHLFVIRLLQILQFSRRDTMSDILENVIFFNTMPATSPQDHTLYVESILLVRYVSLRFCS